MRPVVVHVAALAEALEIGRFAVRRIVVKMRCCEDDPRDTHPVEVYPPWCRALVAMPVAPASVVTVEPTAIRQAHHLGRVASATNLAAALGAAEPDLPAQLWSVDGIEPAKRLANRHT